MSAGEGECRGLSTFPEPMCWELMQHCGKVWPFVRSPGHEDSSLGRGLLLL